MLLPRFELVHTTFTHLSWWSFEDINLTGDMFWGIILSGMLPSFCILAHSSSSDNQFVPASQLIRNTSLLLPEQQFHFTVTTQKALKSQQSFCYQGPNWHEFWQCDPRIIPGQKGMILQGVERSQPVWQKSNERILKAEALANSLSKSSLPHYLGPNIVYFQNMNFSLALQYLSGLVLGALREWVLRGRKVLCESWMGRTI